MADSHSLNHRFVSCYNKQVAGLLRGAGKIKQKPSKPPRLLRGLFLTVASITLAILGLSWLIINYQVEQLVAKRSSEYAHSIAQIAANSSAEALLSDDKIQLKMLVENVAKDPYIRSATIFAEDGRTVVEYPEPEISTAEEDSATDVTTPANAGPPSSTTLTEQTQRYMQAQNDIPFVEKIIYQEVTAGWFKISLNRELLESSFRQSLQRSRDIIAAITFTLLILMAALLLRYKRRVKLLIASCHRILQVNLESIPRNKKDWMEALKNLAEAPQQSLTEHPQLLSEIDHWHASRRISDKIFIYCQFSMLQQEDELTAESLSQAEHFLQAAAQAHGVQSQGDILSGCLIPFLDSQDDQEGINEAFGLLHLVQSLFETLPLEITLRAFVGKGSVLVLENSHAVITGISLSNRLLNKINKLAPDTQYGETLSLGLEESQVKAVGEFEQLPTDERINSLVFQLTNIKESIKQQTSRQINYIVQSDQISHNQIE